ncbi:Uncharacterised protein [Mycobacteroides abscessus subsp. abscessus]|nr:Uncharacterised protein [Mycobacteroides abscessus subsp. abscessus]
MIARNSVGISPMPQAIAPPRCWSSIAEYPQSVPMLPNQSPSMSTSELSREMPKKAWKAIVMRSMSRRSG